MDLARLRQLLVPGPSGIEALHTVDDFRRAAKRRLPKMVLAPPEVLIDLLRQMGNFPDKEKSRYLLALMLMRRRIVRPAPATAGEAPVDSPDGDCEPSPEVLRVEVIADGSVIDVPTCVISRSEAEALKDELNELLYCEAEEQ